MSRLYRFDADIELPAKIKNIIIDEVEDELSTFGFGEIERVDSNRINATGEWSLGAGYSKEQQMDDMRSSLWQTIGQYAMIGIRGVYLEEDMEHAFLPDYHRWVERQAGAGQPVAHPRCSICEYILDGDEEGNICYHCKGQH